MRQKHNAWVSLAALVLLALILTWVCTGCTTQAEARETEPAPRFTVERAGNNCRIITDNETGVQYLFYLYDNYNKAAGGLVKLEATP